MYMEKIQKDIQEIAEAIAELTVKDVVVYNKDFKRIAGTGIYALRIDQVIPEETLVNKLYQKKEAFLRIKGKNDEYNDVCNNCPVREKCTELSSVGHPVFLNDEIIGSIWVVACDDFESKRMLIKEKEYKRFLKRMSDLISDRIVKIISNEQLKIESDMINEILNEINDGVMVIDERHRIKLVNNQASKILKVDRQKLVNISFEDLMKLEQTKLFPENRIDNNVDTWTIDGRELKIVYSVIPMQLNLSVVNHIISFKQAKDIINLAKELSDNLLFKDIIGKSKSIENVKMLTEKAAETDSNILLVGETGTGKEIFARTIHRLSKRKNEPFIAVNCASIPETLLESELFGYDKGSFTGALSSGKKGKFELAHGGTLFLDEIGDMPLSLQPKILRVLQEKNIERIGGTNTVDIDVRIFSATHKDLAKMVDEGKFRADLFYRINVIPIVLPPLRERESDVLICADYFAEMYCKKTGKKRPDFSREVTEYFLEYSWPGNVRELQNTVEYVVSMCQEATIKLNDLPPYIREKKYVNNDGTKKLKERLEEYEKVIITESCHNIGNEQNDREKIAKQLGIGIASLYRKIKKHNIKLS